MSNSLIFRVPGSFTDASLPKLSRDPIVNAGTKLVLDFADPYCFPGQAPDPGNGTVFKNLVDGMENAVLSKSALFPVGFSGGGLYFENGVNDGQGSRLSLGNSFKFPLSVDQLVICWMKQSSVVKNSITFGFGIPGVYQFGRGSNDSAYQLSGGTSNRTITSAEALTKPAQLAFSIKAGSFQAYLNGQAVGSPFVLSSFGASTDLWLGGAPSQNEWAGHIYRAVIEDLTASGANPAAQVAKDYEIGMGRGFA